MEKNKIDFFIFVFFYINMVSLEIKNIDEREGNFIFKKIDRSIINALRRILISDVPSYCLDTINLRKIIYMNDDFLSHRID